MTMTVGCFGELLLRLSAPGRDLLLQRPCFDVHVGGAEANVAVGLAALGHATKMISVVPDNPLGRAAIDHLRRYGVDASGVTKSTGGRMGLYFLAPGAGLRPSDILYDREGSSFAGAEDHHFDWERLLQGVDLLHMSGITPALGPGPARVALAAAAAAAQLGIPIAFDVNYRSRLWERWESSPRTILKQIVEKAEIMFGNHRDISMLLDKRFAGDGPERRREASEAAFTAFPKLRIIASTARDVEDADRHRLSARIDAPDAFAQTEEILLHGIIDRIGAGDAFASGILHGLRFERDLDWTVRAGLAVAALKHSLPGDASLFGVADVEAFMSGDLDVRR